MVVEGNGASWFGRSWLQHIRLNWAEIKAVRNGDLSGVLEQNAVVFNQELGEYQTSIHVDPQACPWFYKPRPVPYAIGDEELDQLVESDVLEPVQYAEWAAPIMIVWKLDRKSIRL